MPIMRTGLNAGGVMFVTDVCWTFGSRSDWWKPWSRARHQSPTRYPSKYKRYPRIDGRRLRGTVRVNWNLSRSCWKGNSPGPSARSLRLKERGCSRVPRKSNSHAAARTGLRCVSMWPPRFTESAPGWMRIRACSSSSEEPKSMSWYPML